MKKSAITTLETTMKISARTDLSEVQAILQKRFKGQVLFRASDPRFRIRRISTQIPPLDRLLSGGVALGRTTEFYGPYSAGKSLAVLLTIAEAQSNGMRCGLVDSEKSFDPEFAEFLGVDVNALYMVGDLEKGEELIDYVEVLMRSRKFEVMAIDSVAALVPRKELEASAEADQMGKMGQLTSRMMRKLTAANPGHVALILTNQVREGVGVIFGNPEKPVGGRAIGFFASQRVEFRKGEKIEVEHNGKKVVAGHVVKLKLEKDKTAAQAGAVQSFQYFPRERRIGLGDALIQLGLEDGYVEQVGQRFSILGAKPLYRKAAEQAIETDLATQMKLLRRIKKNHSLDRAVKADAE